MKLILLWPGFLISVDTARDKEVPTNSSAGGELDKMKEQLMLKDICRHFGHKFNLTEPRIFIWGLNEGMCNSLLHKEIFAHQNNKVCRALNTNMMLFHF